MKTHKTPLRYRPAADTLKDRVVLVTGASDGIGRAVAVLAAAGGADLVLLGRNKKKLEATSDMIVDAGHAAPMLHVMDFASATWPDHLALAHALADEYGRLDGLVHAAAILGDRSPILHYDVATWQQVMTVNVTAPFMLTRACLGLLGQSHDASVVYVSSGVGRRGHAHWGAYSVSKFALEGLSQVLADETAENTNIRANAINPGAVRTAMRHLAYPAEDRSKLPTPEDVAPAFIWLLSEGSKGHSGETFDIQ
jgi:NAD(P)-dependent dehydrogenase (short-subunit alcohol dehydrogenase family)